MCRIEGFGFGSLESSDYLAHAVFGPWPQWAHLGPIGRFRLDLHLYLYLYQCYAEVLAPIHSGNHSTVKVQCFIVAHSALSSPLIAATVAMAFSSGARLWPCAECAKEFTHFKMFENKRKELSTRICVACEVKEREAEWERLPHQFRADNPKYSTEAEVNRDMKKANKACGISVA
jgi:hypothetical protein